MEGPCPSVSSEIEKVMMKVLSSECGVDSFFCKFAPQR